LHGAFSTSSQQWGHVFFFCAGIRYVLKLDEYRFLKNTNRVCFFFSFAVPLRNVFVGIKTISSRPAVGCSFKPLKDRRHPLECTYVAHRTGVAWSCGCNFGVVDPTREQQAEGQLQQLSFTQSGTDLRLLCDVCH
jgi:hypothetical protein